MVERDFQAKLIKEIKDVFDGCIVMKNDSSYIQGIPDLLVLYKTSGPLLKLRKMPEHQGDQIKNIMSNEWITCHSLVLFVQKTKMK